MARMRRAALGLLKSRCSCLRCGSRFVVRSGSIDFGLATGFSPAALDLGVIIMWAIAGVVAIEVAEGLSMTVTV